MSGPSAAQLPGIPETIGIISGLKGFMVWIGGSLAGMTAILYVCGYLITTAHIYTLGLYGLVDFSKDYFLLEGAKFVLSVVIGIAQVIVNPLSILAMAVIAPVALLAIFAKGKLSLAWSRLRDWHGAHASMAWFVASQFALYCVLLIAAAVIGFESLRAVSFHLQIADLLYSSIDPVRCGLEQIPVRDAFLCGRFTTLRSAFNTQLWSAITLIGLSTIAWQLVGKWRGRGWLIGPMLFVTVLLVLLLPMEFGALLKPTRYPVVRIQAKSAAPPSVRDQFLIDRSERGLTLWDPATRHVLWTPTGDIARMETVAVRELFDKPGGDAVGGRR